MRLRRCLVWTCVPIATLLIASAGHDGRRSNARSAGSIAMHPDGPIGETAGVQEPGWVGVVHTNAELMARAQAAPAPIGARATDIPIEGIPAAPAALRTSVVPASGLRVDLTFVGATGDGVPDTQGAAGPTQFLVVLNSLVRSFDKATGTADGVLDLSLSAFFAPAGIINAFDPTVRFDRLSGRWLVVALSNIGSTSGGVLVAVSSGGVLTRSSSWTFFKFKEDAVPPAGDAGCRGDSAPIFVGVAASGVPRPDVAAIYGDRFAGSGWQLRVPRPPAGIYDLAVFAHSTARGDFVAPKIVRVRVRAVQGE
jgi:hypothetical protein